jgi:hypothetical protein
VILCKQLNVFGVNFVLLLLIGVCRLLQHPPPVAVACIVLPDVSVVRTFSSGSRTYLETRQRNNKLYRSEI